jgi:ubiquinone/menaquinone biosynthesis C-methylase UbiE
LNVDHYEKLTGFVGDWRDTWRDDDFLQMMAKKWRVENVRSVLDVGCGVGHWGQQLMPLLHAETTLLGVDAEPAWMGKAAHRATSRGLGGRARYEVGDGCARPYEAASLTWSPACPS